MSDCEKLESCAFFSKFKSRSCDSDFADLAIKGLVKLYCKGFKQDKCVRKLMSNELGSGKVPTNLMLCGLALTNTTDDAWSEEVISFIQQNKAKV
jgi:hypothetical protein